MKRSPLRKRRPDPLKARCDALARELTFLRDGHRCVRCGARDHLQWCHVRSRRFLSTRHHLENLLSMCAGCHLRAHHEPLEFGAWFEAAYPRRAETLCLIRGMRQRVDLHLTELWLNRELAKARATLAPPPDTQRTGSPQSG